ncbi:MAG TPA: hypothetical protein VHQ44_05925 [Thermoanaerobaculia bacterium]|nr:hypothetical protein [Thermoanaerobaculia bacterium]
MLTFSRWRMAKDRVSELVDAAPLDRLIALNDVETVPVLATPSPRRS